jgi:Tetratricopeptide repeat
MDDRLTKALKHVAIAMVVAFVGWAVYEKLVVGSVPGDLAYHAANNLFEDGSYERAAAGYRDALAEAPDFAGTWANRGILLDTMGRHEEALIDYTKALQLDPSIAHGPHWLTRFLRNQAEAPPTVADRAAYLRAELAKPEGERLAHGAGSRRPAAAVPAVGSPSRLARGWANVVRRAASAIEVDGPATTACAPITGHSRLCTAAIFIRRAGGGAPRTPPCRSRRARSAP